MGQEILYCFKCQTRLLGSDFEKGLAFRVNSQAACPQCVRELLSHLPDPDAELERLKRTQVPKPSGVTSSSTKMQAVRPESSHRLQQVRPPAGEPEKTSRTPLLIAAVVGGLALLALLAVAFSGSRDTRTTPVATPEPPPPDLTPRPLPRPEPTSAIARDLEELDARLALPMRQEKLTEAAAVIAAARSKHGSAEWSQGIDERQRKLDVLARRLAAPILERVGPAVRKADQVALTDLKSRIEQLGIPTLLADYAAAVSSATADPWIVLDLQSFVAESGATISKQADGSLLVGGKKAPMDTFTGSARIGLRQVRAFRLEALPNPSFPSGGPGRAHNGNFVLSEFKAQSGGTPLVFSGASATHEQDKFPSSASIDGNSLTGWAILPRPGQAHAAFFHLGVPVDLETVTFVLEQRTHHVEHGLGCFRISVSLLEIPPPPAPRPAEGYVPEEPKKTEPSPALVAYRAKWAVAARFAAGRDLAAAVKLLEEARAGVTDADVRKRADGDISDFKLAADALAEVPKLLPRWTKGTKLTLEFLTDSGASGSVEGTILDATARGVSIQTDGGVFDVPAGELGAGSIAALLAFQKKPTDRRAAAILATLEGTHRPELPGRYAQLHGAIDPKEAEARRSFWAAEEDFASMNTRGAAAAAYEKLLQDQTSFAVRNKAFLEDRIAASRDLFFFADELAGSGTFTLSTSPKLEQIWMSSADSAAGKASANFVETEIHVAPNTPPRAWIYAGGCCQEVFTFFLQGTGLSGPSAKNPRETVTTTPGGEEWIAVRAPSLSLKKKHADHTGPKEPDRWAWVELGPLKFAEPGTKKLRILTEQKGFAVAYVAVGAARQTAPRESDVKDLLKNRPPAVYVPTGGILREIWRGLQGDTIPELTGQPKFKGPPDESGTISHIDSWNMGNSYGCRIRGYVHPPATGDYVFWVASDDDSELWLSTDDTPAKKQKLCGLSHAVSQRNWTSDPSQKSAPVPLVAGKRYYIEILQKQGGGSEHVAAGWTLPGGAHERPIPPSRLSPPGAPPVHKASRPFLRGLHADAPFVRSAYVGGPGGREFEQAPHPRQFLLGLKYKITGSGCLGGLQPVFQGPSGDVDGTLVAQNVRDSVIARPGYAVGGMVARGTDRFNAFKLIFMRVSGSRLIVSDRYESEWVGTRDGGAEIRLGDDGTPVVGIFGKAGGEIDGAGLLLQGK